MLKNRFGNFKGGARLTQGVGGGGGGANVPPTP